MKTCLVVDDSPIIREVGRIILQHFNFKVEEASDGREALEKCQNHMPDGILLDWNMPVMDGIEFLRILRRAKDGHKPKVVFCTTESDMSHILYAFRMGANEYILKPFDKEIIRAKFEEVGLL